MHRIRKLLGIIFIFSFVFFIICDEKGIKIGFENNHIVFHKIEKESKSLNIEKKEDVVEEISSNPVVYKDSDLIHINYAFQNPNNLRQSDGMNPNLKETIVYKNSNSIKIYSGFDNPNVLRKSDGMTPEYLANIEREKAELKARDESLKYKGPNIVSLDNDSTISNLLGPVNNRDEVSIDDYFTSSNEIALYKSKEIENSNPNDLGNEDEEKSNNIVAGFVGFETDNIESETEIQIEEQVNQPDEIGTDEVSEEYLEIEDIEGSITERNPKSSDEIDSQEPKDSELESPISDDEPIVLDNEILNTEEFEEELNNETQNIKPAKVMDISAGIENINSLTESLTKTINKILESKKISDEAEKKNIKMMQEGIYKLIKNHFITMKKSGKINHEFTLEESNTGKVGLSESMLENLASNDEIDVNTLESENDEFLQEIFKKTNDMEVMNLIVETYLSEYQFAKAKKFIESLSPEQLDSLDPKLHLQVAFNSFSLTSKTVSSTLISLVENYKLKNQISEEDNLRYQGVVSLMQKNYDHFFELANGFTSTEHKDLTVKLQGYKEQISKQMGMPDYYFDTLVSLELFNNGQFQPAKILALSSLQQNPNYILPYQVLAYANFLTNSRDTSIEYLKKLVDLDPNNAEKYRFLMGIAYYWDKKYEQSVVMLSLVKNQKLRLDAERYLIRDYVFLDQKTKLISIRNKLLGYENLVASDFYTYFYEAFYHPFSEGLPYQIYAFDTELANKMIRVCSMKLSEEEKAVCNYGMIGKNIALGQFDGLEESLLQLATDYPQGYLYQALGEYYIQQGDTEKAKSYLLKAVSLTKRTPEVVQIKKLLQETI